MRTNGTNGPRNPRPNLALLPQNGSAGAMGSPEVSGPIDLGDAGVEGSAAPGGTVGGRDRAQAAPAQRPAAWQAYDGSGASGGGPPPGAQLPGPAQPQEPGFVNAALVAAGQFYQMAKQVPWPVWVVVGLAAGYFIDRALRKRRARKSED